MIRRILALLILLCIVPCTEILAQMVPTVEQISPGMMKWQASMEEGHTLYLYAVPSVQSLFHIRDVSVLQNIFSKLSIESCVWPEEDRTRLSVYSGVDRIAEVDVLEMGNTLSFSLDGTAYQLSDEQFDLSGLNDFEDIENAFRMMFSGHSFLERFSMADIRNILQNQSFFEMLPGNCTASNLTVQETYSDDGLRLTKLDVSGTLYQNETGLWNFSGFIRRPGGTKPKDTAELKFSKDTDNYLDFNLSSQYNTENVKKENSGTVKGEIRATISGKIEGYAVSYTLVLKMRNDWSADGINLSEKITLAPELSWKDSTPGRNYLHLNSGKLTLKNIIRLSSTEFENKVSMATDSVSVNLTMDGEAVIEGTLELSAVLNEQSAPEFPEDCQEISIDQMQQICNSYIKEISKSIYKNLDQSAKDKAMKGLRK